VLEWSFFESVGLVEQPSNTTIPLITIKFLNNDFNPFNKDTLP